MADKTLFYITLAIITISMLASYSLTTYVTLYFGYDQFHFFIRQTLFGLTAIVLMWGVAKIDPSKSDMVGLGIFLSFFLLMLFMHFLPSSIVTSVGGAKRWIKFPLFSLAPVEFFKIGFVYFLAWSFSRKFQKSDGKPTLFHEIKLIVPYIFLFLIAVLSIAIFQNDIGQVMVLGLTLSFMLLFAGRSMKLFSLLIFLAATLFVIFVSISENRIARIKMWWASAQHYILSFLPSSWAQELKLDNAKESYQIINSLHAIHNGGILGQGIGNGEIKLGFLSDIHTDFILSGLTEEIGFIGIAAVTLLYLFLLHRIFKIANRTHNSTLYLFSVGMGMLIGFSFLMNAFGISSLIPIKGIAVPLLSYGGSSMLANALGLGMILMMSKKG